MDLISAPLFCLFLLLLSITIVLYFLSFVKHLQRGEDKAGKVDLAETAKSDIRKNPYVDPSAVEADDSRKVSRFCDSCGATLQSGVCENHLCNK